MKPKIIALHGFTGSGRDFGPLASPTQALFDWEYPDYPFANALLDNKTTALLGYSMGGRIALHMALKYPERIEKLILVGASPGIQNSEQREKRKQKDEDLASKIAIWGTNRFLDFWSQKPLLYTQKNIKPEILAPMLARKLKACPKELAQCLRAHGTGALESLWAHLPKITCEVHLVAGENDFKFCAINKKMAQLLPSAICHVVPSAGHMAHLENPDWFLKFLKSLIT